MLDAIIASFYSNFVFLQDSHSLQLPFKVKIPGNYQTTNRMKSKS